MWSLRVLCTLCLVFSSVLGNSKKPNIIFIIADDMGFNDVSFHGSNEIPTPNIDALAYNGVILNNHYTQALCTPSRSSLLTGKYPIHLGMQHLVILEPEPWGLPLNETLLPQHLKNNGYVTHAVGKWHLGFFKKEYTPTYRGFDSHFGYWQGLQDYYKHTTHATYTEEYGYDMRRNMSVDWSAEGKYSTTLFTEEAVKLIHNHNTEDPMFMYLAHLAPHTGNDNDPLQAPDEEIAKFAHIEDPERRVYAAMVTMLDKSVGSVVTALREKHMLENSIIVFMSDNGAQPEGIHANHGSNYPFRGAKASNWEGALRNIAAIWSPLIKNPQRVSNHMMHISDWMPTLFSAAGLDSSQLGKMDGMDMWKSISEDVKGPRTEILHNIDDIWNIGSLRQGDWKYVYGSASKGLADHWFGNDGRSDIYHYDETEVLKSPAASALAGIITFQQIKEKKKKPHQNFTINLLDAEKIQELRENSRIKCQKINPEDQPENSKCFPMETPCLFNIKDDPCEIINLASARPMLVSNMEQMIMKYRKTALPIINKPRDPNADPKKWNNTWTNWQDCEYVVKQKIFYNHLSPLTIGLVAASCVGFLIVAIILVFVALKKKPKRSSRPSSIIEDAESDSLKCDLERKLSNQFEDKELRLMNNLRNEIRTVE